MKNIAIIGAGAMGLAAAYHSLKNGHKVTIFEVGEIAGGMAAHFDLEGLSVERFYHFICKTDYDSFDLFADLGITHKLKWVDTSMGYYIEGKHYKWGDPISLLKFPLMSWSQKLRYGASAFWQTKRKDFDSIEHMTAKNWIIRDCGEETYNLMWKRLLELKFYEYTDKISASWIATRVRRTGRSRKSIFQESLGYLEGGSQTLVNSLVENIEKMGGKILLSEPVLEVMSKNNKVEGVRTKSKTQNFDEVISTVPTPLVSKMVPNLSNEEKQKYDSIDNIGVVCLTFRLKKQVTKNFWLNVIDENMEIPGIIELSNLRTMNAHVVYVPYYMPLTNPKFKWDDQEILSEAFGYLQKLNPELLEDDLISSKASRLKYSQPICTPNFREKLPNIKTSIDGLQIADTCFYYPEDRGISESVKLGKIMANNF